MQPYPISRSWSGQTPLTVAAVPTGMNAGVRRDPLSVEIIPARAAVPPSRASTVNRSVIVAGRGTLEPTIRGWRRTLLPFVPGVNQECPADRSRAPAPYRSSLPVGEIPETFLSSPSLDE